MAFGFGFGLARGGSTGGPFATAALDLNFLGGSLDSKVTFTRASTATYVNSSGYITTASTNTPRFDYNPATLAPRGLLIEESRANSLLYSSGFNQLSAWAQTNSTVTATPVLGPDNALSAYEIVYSSSGSRVTQNFTAPATTVTFSVFLKQDGTDNGARLLLYNSTTATIVGTNTISSLASGGTAYVNGWRRYTLTVSTGITVGNTLIAYIYTDKLGGTTAGSKLYAFGAQVEAGAFATSYIPTTTATVTRAVDVASMTSTNFSSWFNGTTGTFYGEGAPITSTPGVGSSLVDGWTGTTSGTFSMLTGSTTTTFALAARIGAVNNSNAGIPITYTAGGVIKSSVSYNTGATTFGLVLNGTVITANSISSPTTAISLYIGSLGGASNFWNGWIRRIAFFNTKLTDAQMQTLTG